MAIGVCPKRTWSQSQGRPRCGLQGATSDMRDVRLGKNDSSGGCSRLPTRGRYRADVIDSHIRPLDAQCIVGGPNLPSIVVSDGPIYNHTVACYLGQPASRLDGCNNGDLSVQLNMVFHTPLRFNQV